jgi:glyceraldehyde 3-phosphate dehydrogenase
VSADIVGNPHSCVLSACDTMVRGTRVKVLGWYDNEWGYAHRLLELAGLLGGGDGGG